MARIQINLELDSNLDAELLKKLTVALGGGSYGFPVAEAVAKGAISGIENKENISITGAHVVGHKPEDTYMAKASESKVSSEEELKSLPNAELKAMATDMGIDWDNADGKNTNAKLAKLIIRHQENNKSDDITSENTAAESNPETIEKESDNKTEITVDDLKVELGAKVEANRDKIVEKLTELGATKITNLDESHFGTFMTFLKSL